MTGVLGCALACGVALAGMGGATVPLPVQFAQGQGQGVWGATDVPTTRVVRRVQQAAVYCDWLGAPFAPDCLADQFAQIARTLPETAGWDPLRAALAEAERGMAEVVRRYADPTARTVRPDERGNPATVGAGRVLRKTLPPAAAAARRVVEETETRLLRSVARSDQRAAAFRRIAAAIGSTKTLLRST
jgi:hypothetical protein